MIELRRIVDAAFYLLRTGCQWRALPREFPPWPTVFYHYAKWRTQGTWERINAVLREQHRVARRRKRHILVDTEGNLPKARVHPADIHDRRGAELLLAGLAAQFPHIALLWADSAYQGLKAWLATTLGWVLTISKMQSSFASMFPPRREWRKWPSSQER